MLADGLDFADKREPAKRLDLDLPDTLSGQAEMPADLLERAGIAAVEAVAEDDHLAFAVGKVAERPTKRLAAEMELDSLFGERVVTRDEVAECGVVLLSDRGIETGRRTSRR